MPNASRKKISSQVDEEWRKEQNNILSAEAKIVEEIGGGKSPEGLKPGTLHKNMKAIDHARSTLEETEAKLANKAISAEEKQRLLANQKRARAQLKRAQESMRKNLNVKKQKID
jgi:multidrug resistance efflux pump